MYGPDRHRHAPQPPACTTATADQERAERRLRGSSLSCRSFHLTIIHTRRARRAPPRRGLPTRPPRVLNNRQPHQQDRRRRQGLPHVAAAAQTATAHVYGKRRYSDMPHNPHSHLVRSSLRSWPLALALLGEAASDRRRRQTPTTRASLGAASTPRSSSVPFCQMRHSGRSNTSSRGRHA